MQVLSAWPNQSLSPCALTIGTFDGVHRGHQLLVETLRREAGQHGLPSAAVTFEDMPYKYFDPTGCPNLLTLADEKIAAFSRLGLDRLIIVPFDHTVAQQAAPDFVCETLMKKLGMQRLVVGPDFALGRGRTGDVTALREMGAAMQFSVRVLEEKLLFANEPISSTRVRGCVENGDMRTASEMLGRPFALGGDVITGQQLGRTIGVPTINFAPHPRKVLPSKGVYAVRAAFDNDQSTLYSAALNIGLRPTVDGTRLSLEFHVLDREVSVPPQRVHLEIIERLRDEKKFAGLDELVAQMRRDIHRARDILQ
ncbi:MAG: riboflavin kinase / adenylyltransferase [Abditibacteriota bacterium]|nr:riboflavin kinase / adenylyltransferase [Abditibacteriota bacterium]